ncbi:hypothetical protein GJAV_G00071440 [Gymnothorax javanicus]|nr:hypothetical protein GJAV_G00071440 [Gymnothorax javanicus]
MTTNAERKFINLRKRLDQLGYRQPLGIESLPLVEKLFNDLVHTTESLRNAKLSAGKTEKESRNVDAVLEPYRAENARLVRESNQLHLDLLRLKEEKERLYKEQTISIRKLEQEMCDLRFLNNQYVHKLRSLEKDCKAKTDRIQQLQEKNLQAVVQTPGGKKRSIPFRRQRMQIDDLIPPSSAPCYPTTPPDDPYIADLLQVADNRIQELQQDLNRVLLELEQAQRGVSDLNTQVADRDGEIERLNRVLSGGRPHDVISLEAQNVSNEKLISHLNLQIEYLQEANRELEQQVREGRLQKASSMADLSARDQELRQELSHIQQLAHSMQQDRELVLETADSELQEAKNEILRQSKAIEDLEDMVSKLRRDLAESERERGDLRAELGETAVQRDSGVDGVIGYLEEEKRRLQERVEKLTSNERELVVELEQMRLRYGVCGAPRSPSRLDAFVRSLEEERDYYKQEAEHLWKGGARRGSPAHSPGRGRSPRRSDQGRVREAELLKAVMERDELQETLSRLERHMEDIQSNVKELTAERDTLRRQYQQVQQELAQVCGGTELSQQKERAESDLGRMTAERDVLLERLKIAQSATLTEREEERRRFATLENYIQTLQEERTDLLDQLAVMKESKMAVEAELKSQSATLAQATEEAAQLREESGALRLLQEQMDQCVSEYKNNISVKSDQLQAAHAQIQRLEERLGELSSRDEVTALQKTVTTLDRQKDALQDIVDQKTERIVALQDDIAGKEKTLAAVRLSVSDMETSLQRSAGGFTEQSSAGVLDSVQEELVEVGRAREIALRENRRLQDDLRTMTRENQAVHAEMEEALREKDELKLRVQSYISEVARIEALMAAKEQENRAVLERFRAAHSEAEDREVKLQQAEGLNNSIRLELLSADTERRHLRERVCNLEAEVQEHMNAQQVYEAQSSSLVRSLSRLEEQLQLANQERDSALADMASVRELCVKLDSSKEMTSRQLTSKSMELERVMGELEDVRSEAELLKKQLTNERLTVRNLETLLSSNRQKEFETQLSASERQSEVKVLKDRLTLADSKAVTQAREVSQLRGKVSQLQTELDVLKRQLTKERFERERAVQEMRRQGVSFSSIRSSSPLNSSLSPRPSTPERSALRTPERTSPEKSVSFKEP